MKWILWLCVAMLATIQAPAAAQQGRVEVTALPKPLPQSIDETAEAKSSFRDCTNFEKEGKSRTEGVALCLNALKYHGGADVRRHLIRRAMCLNRGPVLDTSICHDSALEAWADFDPKEPSSSSRLAEEQRIIDVALPSMCQAGHGPSCLLLGQIVVSKSKDDNHASQKIDCQDPARKVAELYNDECEKRKKIAGSISAITPKFDPVVPMTAEEGIRSLERACARKVKSACEIAAWARYDALDVIEQGPRPAMPHISNAEYYGARCLGEKHQASCLFMAKLAARRRIDDAAKWYRAACDANDGASCTRLAEAEAGYGDVTAVEPALIKACTLNAAVCLDLENLYQGKLGFRFWRTEKPKPVLMVDTSMMRRPERASSAAQSQIKDRPLDWNYLREGLALLRKRTMGKRSASRTIQFLQCDNGDVAACGAAGMNVPQDTPAYVEPAREAFLSSVLAKADDRCRVKKEADYCYDTALVLLPNFPGAKPEDLPRAMRFGAAACILERFDMCAFAGSALVEGKHGGPPDRKNGGSLLNKGCVGRDAKSCYFLAIMLAQDGRMDQAKLTAQTALEINPTFAEAKELLAKLN